MFSVLGAYYEQERDLAGDAVDSGVYCNQADFRMEDRVAWLEFSRWELSAKEAVDIRGEPSMLLDWRRVLGRAR